MGIDVKGSLQKIADVGTIGGYGNEGPGLRDRRPGRRDHWRVGTTGGAYIVAGQLPATLVTARMYLVPRSAAENFRRGLPGNPQLRAGAKKAGANGEAAAEKEKKSRRKT